MDNRNSAARAPGRKSPASPSRAPGGRERRRRNWTILAILFPLVFFLVIAIGLAAMYFKRMEFFRPGKATAQSIEAHAPMAARDVSRGLPGEPGHRRRPAGPPA